MKFTIVFIIVVSYVILNDCSQFSTAKAGEHRHHLESLVFEKEGQPRPVEEFRGILRALNHIWTTPNSLVNTLIKLNEVSDCDEAQHYITTANNILKQFREFINIVAYIKHERELLIEKCFQYMRKSYLDSYNEIQSDIRDGLTLLKEQIKTTTKGGGLLFLRNQNSFYSHEALVKGIYKFLKSQSNSRVKKINERMEINEEKFRELYNKFVSSLCGKLFSDLSTKDHVGKTKFFFEQVAVADNLMKPFNLDVLNLMSRVYICLDIERNQDLSSDVYGFVKQEEGKKCFLSQLSCFH